MTVCQDLVLETSRVWTGWRGDGAAALWVLAVAFFGVGDLATTAAGLAVDPVVELAPTVRTVAEGWVLPVMVLLKGAVFALSYLLWRATPRPHDVGVPLGLATLGILVTGWNAVVLVVAY